MILIKKPFQMDLICMPLKRQITVTIKRKKCDELLIAVNINPEGLGS